MKLCTVCGVVTSRLGSRCTDHARASNRSRHNALYSTREWQRLGARVLRAWRGEVGEIWLFDWKSSKSVADAKGRVWAEMRLQLAAYAHAEFIARVGDQERHALPPITRHGVLHVTDGGTRLYPADITEADWTAFRACLWLHRWRSGKAA